MTLFEPDFLKPPGCLRLQYDTWEVVSRGVLQNVSSRPSRRKPFQVEFQLPGLRIRQGNIQYAVVHANVCMLRGIWPYSHCLQRRNLCQSRPLQARMGGREVRRVKASAWNFELFPNPVFEVAMRIISRIHVDDLRDLVRKDSGDDQTLNLSLKG